MRLLNEEELKTCTEVELRELYRRMMFYLRSFPEGSLNYLNAQMNILRLREAITRRAHLRPR